MAAADLLHDLTTVRRRGGASREKWLRAGRSAIRQHDEGKSAPNASMGGRRRRDSQAAFGPDEALDGAAE
jgi:hypothetical protein